jgi:hypothetical protein
MLAAFAFHLSFKAHVLTIAWVGCWCAISKNIVLFDSVMRPQKQNLGHNLADIIFREPALAGPVHPFFGRSCEIGDGDFPD